MLIQPRRRTFLDRAHPLVRGRVTWMPFDGHLGNMGDLGGRMPPPAGTTFGSSGAMGPLPGNATATTRLPATTLQMGVAGAAPRTVFLHYRHPDTHSTIVLFSFGSSNDRRGLFSVVKTNYTGLDVGCYYDDFSLTATDGYGDYDVWAVVTYDGGTTLKSYVLCRKVSSGSSAQTYRSASYTLATPLVTDPAAGVWLNYATNQAASGDGATALRYFGILGGAIWTAAEANAWLAMPDQLWTPRQPFAQLGKNASKLILRRPLLTVIA